MDAVQDRFEVHLNTCFVRLYLEHLSRMSNSTHVPRTLVISICSSPLSQ